MLRRKEAETTRRRGDITSRKNVVMKIRNLANCLLGELLTKSILSRFPGHKSAPFFFFSLSFSRPDVHVSSSSSAGERYCF
jgi:hypothetical protein